MLGMLGPFRPRKESSVAVKKDSVTFAMRKDMLHLPAGSDHFAILPRRECPVFVFLNAEPALELFLTPAGRRISRKTQKRPVTTMILVAGIDTEKRD